VFIDTEAQIYANLAALPGGWAGFKPFVVAAVTRESDCSKSFALRPADGAIVPHFLPGQYVGIQTEIDGAPVTRNYSVSCRPGLDTLRITVNRERASGDAAPDAVFSAHLHDNVKEGDTVNLTCPTGSYFLPAEPPRVGGGCPFSGKEAPANAGDVRPLAFISGGVGITPFVSMLESLQHLDYEHPVHVLAAFRAADAAPFTAFLAQLATERPNFKVTTVFDNSAGNGTYAVDATRINAFLPLDAECYVCGPRGFTAVIKDALKAGGVSDSRVHSEVFGPAE
jgi:nitric oxide dioxygenase